MTTREPQELTGFEIAIIGLAGRFPGARDVAAFWDNLRNGVESIRFMSEEELVEAGVDPALVREPNYVPAAAILDDIELFDASFFGFTPREAEIMDPQHRHFLETSWNALENAGYDPSRCPGPVGVYGGTGTNAYLVHNLLTSGLVDTGSLSALFGNHTDFLTTRVSYQLDLKGPSLDVQTSCSTSLVAVHLACQALLSGECDLALAGGSSITIPHKRGYLHQEQGIYSPDGHCHAFSSKAEGTAGGSGVAVVTLRRLEDALEDGDSILAVIKGSAINNDGSGKVGYAAPSVDGQAQVIRNALSMAEVEPREMGYIETHGTGTSLGDPIEVAALTQAFRSQTEDNGFCAIGSVKTNIGHLDAAAGVTGLIKAALAIRNRLIPPSLNCEEPSPACDFPNTPFRVNTELFEWKEELRRAGVSSFGIGGTNAHVVLEQAPEPKPTSPSRSSQLIVLSARTPKALEAATTNLAEFLAANPEADLADVAYTLQVGRKGFDHRRIVTGEDAEDIRSALETLERKRVRSFVQQDTQRPVVFLFTGQGSQYVGMGRALYESEPTFRDEVDRGAELLKSSLGFDLREVIYAPDGDEAATAQLAQTSVTQPALFVIEYAMARLWMEWGLSPQAMIGHSIGEYVAATLAGVFEYETALELVAERGRLMQELPAGAMLAVLMPAAEVESELTAGLSLAAVNEQSTCVVSGSFELIEAFEKALEAKDIACSRLHTSHAFHSEMMDPVLEPFTDCVRAVQPKSPQIPFISNLTGTWITEEQATDPTYWADHLRRAVRFADGIAVLLEQPERVFVEVGPGNTLTALTSRIARTVGENAAVAVSSMRHPRESRPDVDHLLDALGQLWMARVSIDWDAFYGRETRRRIPLPTYPFARERFWIEPGKAGAAQRQLGRTPDIADWFYAPSWTRSAITLTADAIPAAGDYLIFLSADGLGLQAASLLREAGKRVSTVVRGKTMTELGEDEYSLNPGSCEDYQALAKALQDTHRLPEVVLHLWSCDASTDTSVKALDRGFYSLLYFAQAIETLEQTSLMEIVMVTHDVLSVTGREELIPSKAAVLGACQAIPQECANLRCRTIDLEGDGTSGARELLREVASGADDLFVAYRNSFRWVETHEAVSVPALKSETSLPKLLRKNGHYFITGGLGSIGLEVAACLAAAPGAKLVLSARSEFHARDTWDAWLDSHAEEDETSRRIRKLKSIEDTGAELSIIRADAGDLESMRAAFDAAEANSGPLNGVVHAAGAEKVLTILQQTTREECDAQFHPKLAGLKVLEELLAERPLDFCIIQSSLSSSLGSLGMIGYVGAHHLVDAFALRHNRGDATPWTRVNWDNWLSWKDSEISHASGEATYFMSQAEGAEAFRRVLNLPPGAQLAVSTGDLGARIDEWLHADRDNQKAEAGAELHARPDLGSEFEAPRNPAEQALATAWSDVLGIGNIGIHDSFFELGGDSVLGLQVVAKTSQQGYRITPAMIFEHSTIAELATVAELRETTTAEQGQVKGLAPLVPVQHWFFGQDVPTPEHFNLPMMFEVPADSEARILEQALADVVRHHDALRMRYRTTDSGIEQFFEPDACEVSLEVKDLSETPDSEREAAMIELATSLHRDLDLERGPLMRAALFRTGADRPALLLWISHHLLVDVVGWRVMLEDFAIAREQRAAGKQPKFPPKSTSFQAWSNGLVKAAQSTARHSEISVWTSLAERKIAPIPTDFDRGENLHSSSRTVTASLGEEATRALLQEVPSVYETRIDEVLLTALVTSYSRWARARGGTDQDELFVDLEGHGREDVVEGADLSRTVGWFTTIFPACFSLTGIPGAGEGLKSIKEQLRAIPDHGIGFGMLRYLSADAEVVAAMSAVPKPEMNFLYLGQFGGRSGSGAASSEMHLLAETSGPPCSPNLRRLHLFELVAFVQGGQLRVELSYSENRHERTGAEALLGDFVAELEALIAHCQDPEAGGRTPSDFPAAGVSQSDLDKLMAKMGRAGGSSAKGSGK